MQIPDPADKIMSLEKAVQWRETLSGRKLVVTNGCFDVLHRGHAEYLRAARNCGDALLVLINADDSIRLLKGPSRPINKAADRAYLLASLACVDAVVVFDSMRCNKELVALHPDIYAKGGDYTVEKLDAEERSALLACNAAFRFIPFVAGFSTTSILAKI